jgi:hypothetical protein
MKLKSRFPKKIENYFADFGEYDCRQVNLHIGRKNKYWFVEPNEKPIITDLTSIPEILKDKKIEFHRRNF